MYEIEIYETAREGNGEETLREKCLAGTLQGLSEKKGLAWRWGGARGEKSGLWSLSYQLFLCSEMV